MAIKIKSNTTSTMSVKIKTELINNIDLSLEKIKEITGVKLTKNEWVELLLDYALENAPVELNDKEVFIKDLLSENMDNTNMLIENRPQNDLTE